MGIGRWGRFSAIVGSVILVVGLGFAWSVNSDPVPAAPPDIRHYDLDIRPDFQSNRLGLEAALDIDNPGLQDTFTFELSQRYTTVEVRERSSDVSLDRKGGTVTVRLSRPSRDVRLTFTLEGPAGRCEDEDREVLGEHDLFLLWSDRFYPIVFADWATVRTTITLPEGFQAIAPGRLTSTSRAGDRAIHVFETTHPTTKFSVFADDRWIRTERVVDGLRMQTLLHPQSEVHRERIFASSRDVIAFFTDLHGGYAFDGFAFVTLENMYARRAFAGFIGYSPAYLDKEMARTGHDAHETSLLWWGYTTGGRGPGSFQWTEGLGDYVETLYDEARGKPIPKNFDLFREDYLRTPAGEDVPYTQLRGNTPQKIVHGKYPWLMHVMRYVVGDGPFRSGLRLLFERYRFRTFSMDEFVSTLEEGTGSRLGWWKEEWLERQGVPTIRLRWAAEPAGEGFRITGSVTQVGNLYHIPLEVGIETEAGTRVERISLTDRETPFAFTSMQEPRRLVPDPNRWLLLRIDDGEAGRASPPPTASPDRQGAAAGRAGP